MTEAERQSHCPHRAATRHWSGYTTPPEESLAIFEEARRECPVAYSEEFGGYMMLLAYDLVRRAASDHRSFSSEPQVLRPMVPRKPVPALEMDPPRHGTWRALFNGAITSKTPKAAEDWIRADVNRHIDTFIERSECDLVAELAEPVPAETICRLVGIDDEKVPEIRRRALAMFAAQGEPEEFERRLAAFAEVTVSEVQQRRAQPREDYLTHLATIEVEGKPLADEDCVVLMTGFLGAGHHSTTSAIASLIMEVLSRPALRDELAREPDRIPVAVEETLRLHPPFFGFFRRAAKAVEVGGVEIEPEQDVYLAWAAANRDARVFDDPTAFRMDRGQNRHLTFGFGIHTCPGAALARLEMAVTLEELLRRMPDLELIGERPEYRFGGGDYAYLPHLRVRFTPGELEYIDRG